MNNSFLYLLFLMLAGIEFSEVPGIRPLVTDISCWKLEEQGTTYHVDTGRTTLTPVDDEPAFKTIKELWGELNSKCRLSRKLWLRTRYPGTDREGKSTSLSEKEIEYLIDLAKKDGFEIVPIK